MKTRVIILKVSTAILFLLCVFAQDGNAQYVNSGLSLANTMLSSVNWVDVDDDGDLDASISGRNQYSFGTGQGILYFFESNNIVDNSTIPPLMQGDMSWCDFNNDNLPDMLYSGDNSGLVAGIDTFNISDKTFYNYFTGFNPVTSSSLDWGDYDNDGDYDVLISGQGTGNRIFTALYRNDKGSFTAIMAGLPGIINGKIGFIDYDLDQDLDIFISGQDINTNKYTRLWENNGGIYSITSDQFVNLAYSRFEWGDFNSDGYPDLLLGGDDGSQIRGLLYINNSGNSFSLSNIIVPGSNYAGTGFGDIDNDGDLDVHCSGGKQDPAYNGNVIYINDGSDSLKPAVFTMNPLLITNYQFGDYDNDNDLDFIINGYNNGPGATQIHINTTVTANLKPAAPQNLTATISGTSVILTWDHATDNNTPQKALTYNIYVGTVSMGVDIVSPLADISNGFRKISKQGYIQDTAWIIKDLPTGTYFWGVQSIDNSLAASPFSAENSFEIKNQFTESAFSEAPNTTTPAIYIDYDYDNDYDLFLSGDNKIIVSKNTGSGFSPNNYDTIFSDAFNPLYTIAPNDYNNDNFLDFSLSGNYSGDISLDSSIVLFGSTNGVTYDIIDSALVRNTNFEYALWADFNNDGLQDMITSGRTTNLGVNDKPVTYIFKNKGDGSFQEVSHTIRGFEDCGAVTADFDNDMDIDLVIYGRDSLGILNTYQYNNNGDFNFIENVIPDNQLYRYIKSYGILAGDYDLDGELDIYMAGRSSQGDNYARVLLNHNLIFDDANLPIRSWRNMSNFWADYDYDGDLDIFSASTYGTSADGVRLYINNNQVLEEIVVELGDVQQLDQPFLAPNLDNKNGLDFIMKINDGDYVQFFDNYAIYDKVATPPTNLNYERSGLDVILKWDKVADCPGCTYNIWIGTHPDSVNIMSPMADKVSGFRYVIQPGNAFLNNRWKISDLPADTYYWSVQAVDLANTGGPWAEMASIILVNVSPEFTYDNVCLGSTNDFYDLSVATDAVVKWNWNFGDGTGSSLQNPQHLYTSSGTFTVGLWAYSLSGDSAYQSHDVIVKSVPLTAFSADIACQGTATTFTNNTNTNGLTISTWQWNFGDLLSSTQQDPGSHGYINPGTYKAELWAYADNGCSDSTSRTVIVSSVPVAVVTGAPLTFCNGDSITLSANYSKDFLYSWKMDGAGLTGADSSKYVARLSGNYSVEVVNPVGNCSTTSSQVTVTARNAPLAPSISASGPLQFCEGDSVILSVTNTSGYIYDWKKDGGATGTNLNSIVAKSSGLYSLVVSNSTGCSVNSSNTVNVIVIAKPVLPTVNISGQTEFCQGGSVDLSVTNNTAYIYQWENNGATISGAISNIYSAQNSGIYRLKISNSDGCITKTENVTVNVLASPTIPTISAAGPLQFCQGDSVTMSVTNTTGYEYLWKLNGGAVGTNSNQFTAKDAGSYNLVVSNSNGCSVSATNILDVIVNVLPAVSAVSFSGAPQFCQGGSITLSVAQTSGNLYNWRNDNGPITGATANSYTASTSGNYRLDISNAAGCTVRTSPVSVTVRAMPVKPAIVSDNYHAGMCLGEDPVILNIRDVVTGVNYQWYRNGVSVNNATSSSLGGIREQAGYSVEADLNGCKLQSDIMDVSFADAPDKPLIYAKGPTIWYLVCSSNSAASYKWYYNGTLIPGADTYLYVANQNLGRYNVLISNDKGCVTISDTLKIPSGAVGIEDIDPFSGLKIYPNPTTGIVTFELDNNIFGELDIRIFTNEGRQILNLRFEKTTEHFQGHIDLSGQTKGIYLINFLLEDYFANRKIVVE